MFLLLPYWQFFIANSAAIMKILSSNNIVSYKCRYTNIQSCILYVISAWYNNTVFISIWVKYDTSPLWWSKSIELSCIVFYAFLKLSVLLTHTGHRCLSKADSIVHRLSGSYSLPLDLCISVKYCYRVPFSFLWESPPICWAVLLHASNCFASVFL